MQNTNFTYNGVLNILNSFAEAHMDIKRFIAEDIDQMSEKTSKGEDFPVLFVAPLTNIYDYQINQYRLRVYVYDRLMKDRSNINDMRSKTNQILNDLDVWLRKYDQLPIEITEVSTAIPFSSELMDYVTGWYFDFTLDIPSYEVCKIPFSSTPVITGFTCDVIYTNQFLTCEDLEDCDVFNNAINNLQEQINNLSGATGDNFYTTGATLSGNTIIFSRTDLSNAYSVDLSSSLFSGNYDDLSNKPTNLSDFNNDEGFLNCNDLTGCTIIQDIQNDATFTIDLIDENEVTFYAPYDLKINSFNVISGTGTITIEVNNVAYTLDDLIIQGDSIKVITTTPSVVNLIVRYE